MSLHGLAGGSWVEEYSKWLEFMACVDGLGNFLSAKRFRCAYFQ